MQTKLFIFALMSLLQVLKTEAQEGQKPIFLYVGDPLCSWCYGFTPELEKLRKHYDGALQFEMALGGLRPYNQEIMDDKLKVFLKEHWLEIAEKTGQPFSFGVLKWENFNYDTEPACRAVVVAREMNKDISFAFFEAVQKSFYAQNQDPTQLETFLEIALSFGLDKREFWEKFTSDEYKKLTNQDFQISRQLDVKGFPSTLMRINSKWYVISRGYRKFEELRGIVEKTLVIAQEEHD